jgi:hypothetical protein
MYAEIHEDQYGLRLEDWPNTAALLAGCDFVRDGWSMPPALTDHTACPAAKFLDAIGTKVIRVFLLAVHCHLYERIYSPHPEQKGFETGL